MKTLDQSYLLTNAELDLVSGGAIRPINPIGRQISNMLLNGVLDPLWKIVGATGHLPLPGEY
jgi:hypothetical protein